VGDPGGLLGGSTDVSSGTTIGFGLRGVADEVLGRESLNATTHILSVSDSAGSSCGGNGNLVSVGLGEDGGGGLGDSSGGPGVADVSGEGNLSSYAADGIGSFDECNHDEEII